MIPNCISNICIRCILNSKHTLYCKFLRNASNWRNSPFVQWRRDNKNMYGPKLSARQVAKRKQHDVQKNIQNKLLSHSKETGLRWRRENELLYGPLIKVRSGQGDSAEENTIDMCTDQRKLGLLTDPIISTNIFSIMDTSESTLSAIYGAKIDTSAFDPILAFPLINNVQEGLEQNDAILPEVQFPPRTKIPSVTHILKETMSADNVANLKRWEERMILELGDAGFQAYKRELFAKGENLHDCIEKFLFGCPEEELPLSSRASGHWQSLRSVLNHIEEVHSTEVTVNHANLAYKGIFDCLAKYRDQQCVIEWKTSTKRKSSIRSTFDNPLQVAAYVGALNYDKTVPMKVDSALLVITYEDGSPADAHHIPYKMLQMYWKKWLDRLHQYWLIETSSRNP